MNKVACLIMLAWSLLPGASLAFGQVTGSQIDETNVQVQLYVDQSNPAASDKNRGTSASPFMTIGAAVAHSSQMSGGTKIWVGPGVYRESVALTNFNQANPYPLILQAIPAGNTTVSGSDVWTGWSKQSNGTYTHSWPYSWGSAPVPSGWPALATIVTRREMIFVNGLPLSQVLTKSALVPGTFYVVDGQSVTVDPPAGIQLSAAQVEVAVRSGLLQTPNGISNLVLRGLTFQHDNTPVNSNGTGAANIGGGSEILVDGCSFRYNNWSGLSAQGAAITIQNSFADHNGEKGIDLYEVANLLFHGNQTSFNNWRGGAGSFTGWDAAGTKACRLHNALISNYVSAYNQTGGLWFDTDVSNVQVTNSQLCYNLTNGVFVEVNEGPIAIQNSLMLRNGSSGLQLSNSKAVTLSNSVAYANGQSAIMIGGSDSPAKVINFQSGAVYSLYSQGMSLQNNSLVGTSAGQFLAVGNLSSSWPAFISTLSSNFNDWYDASNPTPFWTPSGGLSLRQWQSTTGEDSQSLSTAPNVSIPTTCGVMD